MPEEKLFAVTGKPVLHSKSPLMFNPVFKALNIDAAYLRMAADSAAEAMFLFREMGLRGMNVTAPFKQPLIPMLDETSADVRQIGGVNTIINDSGTVKGFNTDHLGVVEALRQHRVGITNKLCLVLGAGGAGRAAVYGLLQHGAGVLLINRTYEKAIESAARLGCRAERLENLENALQNADILVSTLPPGVQLVEERWLLPRLTVLDANYKASELIHMADRQGCIVIVGEDWLLGQAVPGCQCFTGQSPDRELMRQGLNQEPFASKRGCISLVGFMGSGKSSVAHILGRRLGWQVVDSDALIEKEDGKSIRDIFAAEGEAAFRKKEKAVLKRLLGSDLKNTVVAWGGGVVLDKENRDLLRTGSLVVWLWAAPEKNLHLIPPGSRPLLEVDDPISVARRIFAERKGLYARVADLVINGDAGWHGPEEMAEKIHEEIDLTL